MSATATKPTPHYTAVLEITQSTPAYVDTNDRGFNPTQVPKTKREVARVVLRDPSLTKLIERVTAHSQLLTDDEKESA